MRGRLSTGPDIARFPVSHLHTPDPMVQYLLLNSNCIVSGQPTHLRMSPSIYTNARATGQLAVHRQVTPFLQNSYPFMI